MIGGDYLVLLAAGTDFYINSLASLAWEGPYQS